MLAGQRQAEDARLRVDRPALLRKHCHDFNILEALNELKRGFVALHLQRGPTLPLACALQAPGYPSLLAVALSPNAVGIYNEEVRASNMNGEPSSWH